MKKLLLATGCALAGLAVQPAMAQYYIVPHLTAGRNPGSVNTETEGRFDQINTGWAQVAVGTAATQAAPAWSPVQTLPFGFQMNGQTFTSYKVSTSGVLTFSTGATTVPATRNLALPDAQVPDNSLCMWGTLMTANADFLASKTYGAAPNRQHWVQFNSVSIPVANTNIPATNGFIYGAIVLEESSNKVYFVWQRAGANAQSLTVGIQASATQAVQVPTSPNVSVPDLNDTTPADNAYYEFAPGTQPALDIAAGSLVLPNSTVLNRSVPVSGFFRNLGTQTITSFTLNYQVANGPVVSAPLSGYAVGTLGTGSFVHPIDWQTSIGGIIPVKVWVNNPNGGLDLQPGNDTLRTTVVVGDSSMRRKVVQEDFTSSTCTPWCRLGNINTRAINTQPANREKMLEIKYQQNFPAPGTDPYYTLEGRSRFDYYQGSGIPYMILDGGWNGNSGSYTAAILNQFHSQPALARVRGEYTLTGGNTVTATAQIKPFFNATAGRLVAHMLITERETQLNARTNGETVFYDVMKKMLPNENGTVLPAMASGQVFNLSQSFDVSSLPTIQAVEHFDSLRVVVFIQDLVTKEVYQGEHLTLRTVLGARKPQAGTPFSLAPNPATGQTTLYTNLSRPETVQVEVCDLVGRVVLARKQLVLGSGAQEVALDLAHQAAGVYTVRLVTSAGMRTSKLAVK